MFFRIGAVLGLIGIATLVLLALIPKNLSNSSNYASPTVSLPKLVESYQNSGVRNVAQKNKSAIVPILNYHYIRTVNNPEQDKLGFALSVTPENFEQQMLWLIDNNYSFISLDDLNNSLVGSSKLPSKPVIITFDDGYADYYTSAYPILKKYNIPSTLYIITSFIDDADHRYLTNSQIIELDRGGLVTIGSHTQKHANVSNPKVNIPDEIKGSKTILEGILGHKINHFCYPSGKYSNDAIKMVKQSGYITATTTIEGSVHSLSDKYILSRIRVAGKHNMAAFEEIMRYASEGKIIPERSIYKQQ